MILTLQISPELERTLRATAERHGLAPDRYVLDVLQERLAWDTRASLPRAESELLLRLNEGLPEATWARYETLKQKRDAVTLSEAEHTELLQLVDVVEGWNVRRLELAAELARLRGVGLREIVQQLGLGATARA